jgi:hypothetical protein
MPTQGGLAVNIRDLTGGGNKPAQSFGDGGEIEGEVGGEAAPLGGGDPNMEDAQQGIDQDMVDYSVRQKEHKEEQDKVVQIPPQRLEELLGDYDKAMNPDQLVSAPAQGAQTPQPQMPQAPPMPPPSKPPRQGLETKVHLAGGNYDFDGGPETLPQRDNSGYGEIERRAQRIFPMASQGKQREAYIAQMQMQEKKNEGGEHVARVKSEGADQRTDKVFQNKQTLQGEAEKAKAERLDKSLANKRDIAGAAEQGKNTRAVMGNKTRLQTNYESNHPSAKPADIKKYVESMGEEYVPGAPQGQQQRQQGGQGGQGGQNRQPKFN